MSIRITDRPELLVLSALREYVVFLGKYHEELLGCLASRYDQEAMYEPLPWDVHARTGKFLNVDFHALVGRDIHILHECDFVEKGSTSAGEWYLYEIRPLDDCPRIRLLIVVWQYSEKPRALMLSLVP